MQARTRSDRRGETATAMEQVPRELSSPRAKLVYLYLATHGAVTEDDLCEGLDMKRISLYAILKTLRKGGIVTREGDRYVLD